MKKVKDVEDVDDIVLDIDEIDVEEISSMPPSIGREDTSIEDIKVIECPETEINQTETAEQGVYPKSDNKESGTCGSQWEQYMSQLSKKRDKKSKKVFCQIDSELAYTLDECRITDNSRSDMVNAIVRCFIQNNLHKLAEHRQIRKTLLDQ